MAGDVCQRKGSHLVTVNVSTLQLIPLNFMQANPKLDLGGHEDKRNTQTDGDLKMEDGLAGEEEDHGKMEWVRQDKRANNDQSASYTCMELLKNKQTASGGGAHL